MDVGPQQRDGGGRGCAIRKALQGGQRAPAQARVGLAARTRQQGLAQGQRGFFIPRLDLQAALPAAFGAALRLGLVGGAVQHLDDFGRAARVQRLGPRARDAHAAHGSRHQQEQGGGLHHKSSGSPVSVAASCASPSSIGAALSLLLVELVRTKAVAPVLLVVALVGTMLPLMGGSAGAGAGAGAGGGAL